MNFLKKGPEIKLSGIKVPDFAKDVYYDLKDRHLLPVALILVAAIIAVPIAISGNSEAGEPVPSGAGASQSSVTAKSGELVAKAAPGLRDFRRRLDDQSAKDPFETDEVPKSTGEGNGEEGSSGAGKSSGGQSEYGFPSSGSDSGGTTQSRLIHYSYAIDVRITGGSGEDKKTTVRKNLPPLSMLPSRETPALAFLSASKDGKKAVMLVSSDVRAVFGDSRCVFGSETCEMLVLEPGLPETIVYGGAERTYTVELLKLELIETDDLNRAALGNPKKKGKDGELSLAAVEAMRP